MESEQAWRRSRPVCILNNTPSDCFSTLLTGFSGFHCGLAVAAGNSINSRTTRQSRDQDVLLSVLCPFRASTQRTRWASVTSVLLIPIFFARREDFSVDRRGERRSPQCRTPFGPTCLVAAKGRAVFSLFLATENTEKKESFATV